LLIGAVLIWPGALGVGVRCVRSAIQQVTKSSISKSNSERSPLRQILRGVLSRERLGRGWGGLWIRLFFVFVDGGDVGDEFDLAFDDADVAAGAAADFDFDSAFALESQDVAFDDGSMGVGGVGFGR